MNAYLEAVKGIIPNMKSGFDWNFNFEIFKKTNVARFPLVRKYGFAIPDDDAINCIASYSNGSVIELGSGCGYWASLLREKGVDVICVDDMSWKNNDSWHWDQIYTEPTVGSYEHLDEYPNHTLFMCWPNYNTDFAKDSLQAYKGDTFIYVGEGRGGCTGNDAFHELIEAEWEIAEEVCIPQWPGIHDMLHVFKRKKI